MLLAAGPSVVATRDPALGPAMTSEKLSRLERACISQSRVLLNSNGLDTIAEQGSFHADVICRSNKSDQKFESHSLRDVNNIEAATISSRFNSTHWNGHYSQYFDKLRVFYGSSISRRGYREGESP